MNQEIKLRDNNQEIKSRLKTYSLESVYLILTIFRSLDKSIANFHQIKRPGKISSFSVKESYLRFLQITNQILINI